MFNGLRLEERFDGGGEFAFYRARRTPTPYRDVGEQVVVLRASLEAVERRWPPWADPAISTVLHRPSIVSMLEEGVVGSFRYFVFEYMDGGDLRALLRLGSMPAAVSVMVTRAVVDALCAAHLAVGRDGTPFAFVHALA